MNIVIPLRTRDALVSRLRFVRVSLADIFKWRVRVLEPRGPDLVAGMVATDNVYEESHLLNKMHLDLKVDAEFPPVAYGLQSHLPQTAAESDVVSASNVLQTCGLPLPSASLHLAGSHLGQ